MKHYIITILSLATLTTFGISAQDNCPEDSTNAPEITSLTCQTDPPIADAGYTLQVTQKADKSLELVVNEESFVGGRELNRLQVIKSTRDGQLVFRDNKRCGDDFQLIVDMDDLSVPMEKAQFSGSFIGRDKDGNLINGDLFCYIP